MHTGQERLARELYEETGLERVGTRLVDARTYAGRRMEVTDPVRRTPQGVRVITTPG
ncbi:hypothetical protein [Streptomyces atratus]|uniref:hypothetical protein n=1 Tax=Streptomyces atratus TaxID=1893 RepID=UPI0022591FCC|nr:hypothetical protein [Streptomyces atratus]MCX5345311.1 hypothetical protein [Streptomyces atratus]